MLKIVPDYFFRNPDAYPALYRSGSSCLLYKEVSQPATQLNYYLSSHVITVVTSGRKILRPANGQPVTINAGELAVIPRDLYMIQDFFTDREPFTSFLFFFEDRLLSKFRSGYEEKITSPVMKQGPATRPSTASINCYLENLLPLLSSLHTVREEFIELKMLEFLHLVAVQYPQDVQNLLKPAKARKSIVQFMEENFSKPLKVEDYAYLSGRSRSSFLRDFKRNFGTSPKQWLTDRRLQKAEELLLSGNENVTGVSLEVGYEQVSQFIKAFGKKHRCTPGQYLKQKKTLVSTSF